MERSDILVIGFGVYEVFGWLVSANFRITPTVQKQKILNSLPNTSQKFSDSVANYVLYAVPCPFIIMLKVNSYAFFNKTPFSLGLT